MSETLFPNGGVAFVGAGPGDPELLTVKAARIIGQADLVLYAGSLVPQGVVALARAGARVVDSAPLSLDETHALLVATARQGGLAARVHTGDRRVWPKAHSCATMSKTTGTEATGYGAFKTADPAGRAGERRRRTQGG